MSIPLAALYFTVPGSYMAFKDQAMQFYMKLRPAWTSLTESDIRAAFSGKDPGPWLTMVIRTALGRWRLRATAPEPFDNLMSDFERGLWRAPSKETWMRILADVDAKWITERRGVIVSQAKLRQIPAGNIRSLDPDRISLFFPPNTTTAQVGTYLRVIVETTTASLPREPVAVFWETEQSSSPASHRRRLALWRLTPEIPGGPSRLAVEIDLSWEPAWLSPAAHPRALHIASPKADEWKIIGAQFGDSPLMPVFPKTAGTHPSAEYPFNLPGDQ